MPVSDEVEISELLEFDATRVDAVSAPANGTEWLILKAIDGSEAVTDTDGALAEIEKADDGSGDDRPDCSTCSGTGKIRQGKMRCPDCKGSGVKPQPGDTEKSLMELAAAKEAGVAASGAEVPVPDDCPSCGGTGQDETGECDACAGTGKCDDAPAKSELNAVDGDAGSVTEGAGGRETDDGMDKATVSAADQNDLPDSDFAYIEPGGKKDADGKTAPRSLRHFPIMDAAHVRNALARAPQSPFGDKAMPKIKAAAEKFGIDVSDDAEKAAGDVFSAANPALANTDDTDSTDDGATANTSGDASAAMPGSPGWEAVDADTATQAAMALMAAAELMRTFIQREMQEVAAGEGDDQIDAYAVSSAICGVNDALGVMAQMAFHEGLEAAKSLPDDETIEKAGRRLAGKTVAALAAARDKAKDLADHIGGVLGNDDPAKKDGAANKSAEIDMDALSKELENMSTDELTKVLDARDEKLVGILAEALKGAPATAAPEKPAKKTKAAKAEAEVAETETDETVDEAEKAEGDETVETADTDEVEDAGAEKAEAELTPEEIEANDAAKAAKKEAKRLKKAAEDAARTAALTKSIEEHLAKVVEQNTVLNATVETLRGELDGVKKMAAPSNIVRTAPAEAQNVAKARDEIELQIAQCEHIARTTPDQDIRKAKREEAKELSEQLASL